MLNTLWLGLILVSIFFATIDHRIPQLVASVTDSAKSAFEIALGLTGIIVFWLGLFKIAEAAGLLRLLSRLLQRPMSWLFPDVPSDHPAMGAIVMNIAANILGLNNAATPFGLKAMLHLQELNPKPKVATNAMCTFLAVNTSSVTLIPATTIAFLAAAGASDPTDIIITSILATTCSTIAGITAAKLLAKLPYFNREFSDDQAVKGVDSHVA